MFVRPAGNLIRLLTVPGLLVLGLTLTQLPALWRMPLQATEAKPFPDQQSDSAARPTSIEGVPLDGSVISLTHGQSGAAEPAPARPVHPLVEAALDPEWDPFEEGAQSVPQQAEQPAPAAPGGKPNPFAPASADDSPPAGSAAETGKPAARPPAVGSVSLQARGTTPEELLGLGKQYYRSGDWQKAVTTLEAAKVGSGELTSVQQHILEFFLSSARGQLSSKPVAGPTPEKDKPAAMRIVSGNNRNPHQASQADSRPVTTDDNSLAAQMLATAIRRLRENELPAARLFASRAAELSSTWPEGRHTPADMLAEIERREALPAGAARSAVWAAQQQPDLQSSRTQYLRQLLGEARSALEREEFASARQLAGEARRIELQHGYSGEVSGRLLEIISSRMEEAGLSEAGTVRLTASSTGPSANSPASAPSVLVESVMTEPAAAEPAGVTAITLPGPAAASANPTKNEKTGTAEAAMNQMPVSEVPVIEVPAGESPADSSELPLSEVATASQAAEPDGTISINFASQSPTVLRPQPAPAGEAASPAGEETEQPFSEIPQRVASIDPAAAMQPGPGFGGPPAPGPGYGAPGPAGPGYGVPVPGGPGPGYGTPGYGVPGPGYGAPGPGFPQPLPGQPLPPGYPDPALSPEPLPFPQPAPQAVLGNDTMEPLLDSGEGTAYPSLDEALLMHQGGPLAVYQADPNSPILPHDVARRAMDALAVQQQQPVCDVPSLGTIRAPYAVFDIDPARPQHALRIRFDSVTGINRPDRNEYFWGKIGGKGPGLPETNVDYGEMSIYSESMIGNSSGFIEAPLRMLEPDVNDNASGLGLLTLGTKSIIFEGDGAFGFETPGNPDDSFQISTVFRTYLSLSPSWAARGLGNGHTSLEPGILATYQHSLRTYFHGEVKYWIPISADKDYANGVLRYGVGFSRVLKASPLDDPNCRKYALIPTMEVVGWSFGGGLQTLPDGTSVASDSEAIVNVVPGMRVVLGDHVELGGASSFVLSDNRFYETMHRLELRWFW